MGEGLKHSALIELFAQAFKKFSLIAVVPHFTQCRCVYMNIGGFLVVL